MLPPTSLGLEQFPVDAPLTVSPAGYSPAGSLNEAIRIGAQYQPPIGRENDGGRAQPVRADNVRRGEGDVWRGSGQEAQARHGFGGVRVEYIPASTRALFPGQGDECGFYGTILLDLADPIRRIVLRPRRQCGCPCSVGSFGRRVLPRLRGIRKRDAGIIGRRINSSDCVGRAVIGPSSSVERRRHEIRKSVSAVDGGGPA